MLGDRAWLPTCCYLLKVYPTAKTAKAVDIPGIGSLAAVAAYSSQERVTE